MGRPVYLKSSKKNKNYTKVILVIVCLMGFAAASFGILFGVYKNEAPVITHKWKSDETGVILTFTPEGEVKSEDQSSNGIYHIVSPNTLEYTIDGKSFLMTYRIEDQKLYWGFDEQSMESFSRYFIF